MRTPLSDQMRTYRKEDRYPLHMPGHKGHLSNQQFCRKMSAVQEFGLNQIFDIDVTEIPDLDGLHDASGCIKASMEELSLVYQTKRSYYLVNGSSSGNLSALLACGGPVLVARNCHKSVYHALSLMDTEVSYICPDCMDCGILKGLRLAQVQAAYEGMAKQGVLPRTLILTSPTYEGIGSEIKEIVAYAHEKQMRVIVDEAHGAHLPFLQGMHVGCQQFMPSALSFDADFVIQSLHKTLPSMTQTALLHVGREVEESLCQRVEYWMNVFQSSSPSYVFMIAMENAVAYMDSEASKQTIKQYTKALSAFFESARERNWKHYSVLEFDAPMDPSKIVIQIRNCARARLTGVGLEEILRTRFGLQMEMCTEFEVLAMTSVCDDFSVYERLLDALTQIDQMLWDQACETHASDCDSMGEMFEAAKGDGVTLGFITAGTVQLPIGKAIARDSVSVPLEEAIDRVARDFVYVYPPGIPYIVPGEVIQKEVVTELGRLMLEGLNVVGLSEDKSGLSTSSDVQKDGQKYIRVLY